MLAGGSALVSKSDLPIAFNMACMVFFSPFLFQHSLARYRMCRRRVPAKRKQVLPWGHRSWVRPEVLCVWALPHVLGRGQTNRSSRRSRCRNSDGRQILICAHAENRYRRNQNGRVRNRWTLGCNGYQKMANPSLEVHCRCVAPTNRLQG